MSTSTSLTTAQLQALITGIPIHCATTVFSVAGQTLTASQAVTLLSSVLATQTAATAARASLTEAVTARAQTALGDGVVARALRDAIGLQFSSSVSILSSFAITPRKPPKPLSGAARAAATAKAEATRKARGTASKKQKAGVSGNVTGVTITPVTAPEAPAPAATQPAASQPATPAASSGPSAASATTPTHS